MRRTQYHSPGLEESAFRKKVLTRDAIASLVLHSNQ